uniref:DNA-directed RNA polymerase III subunit RPC10-like n=1 Tax=Nicotiana sylvestris TaxID=4096 RepID=A0A1U7WA50_NICSY
YASFSLVFLLFYLLLAVPCPACGYREAAYYQVQIRSADEPMTTFYKCKNKMCGNNWRED